MANKPITSLDEKLTSAVAWDKVVLIDSEDWNKVKIIEANKFEWPAWTPWADWSDWLDWSDGSDWNTILSWTSDPTTEWVDWDYFLNTSSYVLFWPKTAWAWGSWVNLRWPAWEDGADWLFWRWAYDNATTYNINDWVSYNWSSYICIQSSQWNLPTNTSYWNLLAEKWLDGAWSWDMLASVYDADWWARQVAFKINNDSISFSDNQTPPTTPWTLYWQDWVLNIVQENWVIQQVWLEQYKQWQNDTGATISNGSIVYFTSSIWNSWNVRIDKFIADRSIAYNMLIWVVTEDINNWNVWFIAYDWVVRWIDTTWLTAWQILYASPSIAWWFTNVKPSFPNQVIPIAIVRSVWVNWSIEVRVPNSLQDANEIYYDNTITWILNSNSVQDAIDEMLSKYNSAVVLKWNHDASTGSFPSGALTWFSYIINVAWTIDWVEFNVNDRLIAITDNASTTTYANNWIKADYTDQVLSVNGITGAVVLDDTNIVPTYVPTNYTKTEDTLKWHLQGINNALTNAWWWAWWIESVFIPWLQVQWTRIFKYTAKGTKYISYVWISLETLPVGQSFIVTWYKNWVQINTITITTGQTAETSWDYYSETAFNLILADTNTFELVITQVWTTLEWSELNTIIWITE